MIGPFPILQVVGGLIGGVGGFAVGYQLFSLRKPDLGWLARQLRALGALGYWHDARANQRPLFAHVVSVMARTPTDHEQRRVARSGSFRHL
jgi:hypothetical protein